MTVKGRLGGIASQVFPRPEQETREQDQERLWRHRLGPALLCGRGHRGLPGARLGLHPLPAEAAVQFLSRHLQPSPGPTQPLHTGSLANTLRQYYSITLTERGGGNYWGWMHFCLIYSFYTNIFIFVTWNVQYLLSRSSTFTNSRVLRWVSLVALRVTTTQWRWSSSTRAPAWSALPFQSTTTSTWWWWRMWL